MGHPIVEEFKDRIPDPEYIQAVQGVMPRPQDQHGPYEAKDFNMQFRADWEGMNARFHGTRPLVSGVASYIGPDIHGLQSIEVSDCADGDCYVLCCFQGAAPEGVEVGDRVVLQGNYLTTHEEYGVCLKNSSVIHVCRAKGHPIVEVFRNRVPDMQYLHDVHAEMPLMEQDAPFEAKDLNMAFRADWEAMDARCHAKRQTITGVASFVGPDIHGAPSIELSDSAEGDCYVLCCFNEESGIDGVKVGDRIVVRGNYLTTHEEYGICLKDTAVISKA